MCAQFRAFDKYLSLYEVQVIFDTLKCIIGI